MAEHGAEVNEYEASRLRNIERNRERLLQLGLAAAPNPGLPVARGSAGNSRPRVKRQQVWPLRSLKMHQIIQQSRLNETKFSRRVDVVHR